MTVGFVLRYSTALRRYKLNWKKKKKMEFAIALQDDTFSTIWHSYWQEGVVCQRSNKIIKNSSYWRKKKLIRSDEAISYQSAVATSNIRVYLCPFDFGVYWLWCLKEMPFNRSTVETKRQKWYNLILLLPNFTSILLPAAVDCHFSTNYCNTHIQRCTPELSEARSSWCASSSQPSSSSQQPPWVFRIHWRPIRCCCEWWYADDVTMM